MTEPDLIRLLVPDYDQRRKRSEENRNTGDLLFRASVSEVLETNLGFPGKRYLLFAVSGEDGICDQCYFWHIGILDLATRTIIFRHDHGGRGPEPTLKVFRLSGDDRRLCLSFRDGYTSLSAGGYSLTTEEWYRPSSQADGTLEFDHIWSGLIENTHTNNFGAWEHVSSCGRMIAAPGSRLYEYRQKTSFGILVSEFEASPVAPDPAWQWASECDCEECGVEIRRVEQWAFDRHGRRLARRPESVFRIDDFPVAGFPFDLPLRRIGFAPVAFAGRVRSGRSANARFFACRRSAGDLGAFFRDRDAGRAQSHLPDLGGSAAKSGGAARPLRRGYRIDRMGDERRPVLRRCDDRKTALAGIERRRQGKSGSSVLWGPRRRGLLGRSGEVGLAAFGVRIRAGSDPQTALVTVYQPRAETVDALSRQFDAEDFRAMPTALRSGPYRIYFYSHDFSERPHVHVDREKRSAKFWLDPVSAARNVGFSPRELRAIQRLIVRNREKLLRSWHVYFGT
jgi:hypothetical protein